MYTQAHTHTSTSTHIIGVTKLCGIVVKYLCANVGGANLVFVCVAIVCVHVCVYVWCVCVHVCVYVWCVCKSITKICVHMERRG